MSCTHGPIRFITSHVCGVFPVLTSDTAARAGGSGPKTRAGAGRRAGAGHRGAVARAAAGGAGASHRGVGGVGSAGGHGGRGRCVRQGIVELCLASGVCDLSDRQPHTPTPRLDPARAAGRAAGGDGHAADAGGRSGLNRGGGGGRPPDTGGGGAAGKTGAASR